MKIPAGRCSFITVWRLFFIFWVMATAEPMAVQGASAIHVSVFPRRPQVNTWVALDVRGLPARRHRYRLQIRNPAGGPISEIRTRGQQAVVVPIAFIQPVTGRNWRLEYRILRRTALRNAKWNVLQVHIHHRYPLHASAYLLLTSRQTEHHLRQRQIGGLRLGLRRLSAIPQAAIAAFNGCIIGPHGRPSIHAAVLRGVLAAGIPVYQLGALKPPPVYNLDWRQVHLPGGDTAWMIGLAAPPLAARPLAPDLTRIRLPRLVSPPPWRTIAIMCGIFSMVAPGLAFAAASSKRIGWRIGWMSVASLATAVVAVLWINRLPPVDSVHWGWRQRTGTTSIDYSIQWHVLRTLVPTQITTVDISALPVAWSPESWRRLHAVVHFSATSAEPNRITFNLAKGGAAIIRTQWLNFHARISLAPVHWLMFTDGRLHRLPTGRPLGFDDWLRRQHVAVRSSVKAWLILGRDGYSSWQIAVHKRLEVEPLLAHPHR